jgi:hypothetical protein
LGAPFLSLKDQDLGTWPIRLAGHIPVTGFIKGNQSAMRAALAVPSHLLIGTNGSSGHLEDF